MKYHHYYKSSVVSRTENREYNYRHFEEVGVGRLCHRNWYV